MKPKGKQPVITQKNLLKLFEDVDPSDQAEAEYSAVSQITQGQRLSTTPEKKHEGDKKRFDNQQFNMGLQRHLEMIERFE